MPKDLNMSYLLDFYGDILTDKQKEIMEQYYNLDLSLSEIASNFNISRQGVRDTVKRSESILLDMESKIGFEKKYKGIISNIDIISSLTKDIIFYNNNNNQTNDDVTKTANKILDICEELSNC